MVLFGVESADERILKTIKKGITPDDVRKGVKITTDAGMRVYCSFIIGLPGESHDTIQRTISFSDEINRKYGVEYGYHMLAPLPGTELYERADDLGIRIFSNDWADFDANRPIVETENMTREMAQEAINYYDDLLEDAWAEIRRGAEEGNQEWIARLEQKESIGFIWSLLQEDIFDDTCTASVVTSSGPAEAEAQLAHQIAGRLALPDDAVQRQVRRLVQEGLIHLVPEAEGFRWRWQDSPVR
jgi:anaerobic magnesium-protoporphyrin IX monomethyl ester cyclase